MNYPKTSRQIWSFQVKESFLINVSKSENGLPLKGTGVPFIGGVETKAGRPVVGEYCGLILVQIVGLDVIFYLIVLSNFFP